MFIYDEGLYSMTKQNWVESSFITILFLISFINSAALLVFLIGILLLLVKREIGAIKILNLITLRSIINPGLGAGIEPFQNLKFLLLFVLSTYLLLAYKKLSNKERKKINYVIPFVIIYFFYNLLVALIYSSLPTVAIFKSISYTLVFLGILVGVAYTKDKTDWLQWMVSLFFVVVLSSAVMIVTPAGYLANGISFQGITNQPNMFGIVMVLSIGLFLAHSTISKKVHKFKLLFSLSLALVMVIMSNSRTSLLGVVTLLVVYFLFNAFKKKTYLKMALVSFLPVPLILMSPKFYGFFTEFMMKGQTSGNIFVSREDQIGEVLYNFKLNPYFGNGFSVPVLPFRTFEFGTEFIVEPGNILLSVLSYSGIVGFVIFSIYMFRMLMVNKKNFFSNIYLYLSPILISMGEMVFFSSNSIGTWCYMMFALYIFVEKDKSKEIVASNQVTYNEKRLLA